MTTATCFYTGFQWLRDVSSHAFVRSDRLGGTAWIKGFVSFNLLLPLARNTAR